MAEARPYDAIIVGAGPAGLSAALVLGRCGRRVLVCDDNRPRNAASRALNGFLTRDGTRPDEFRRLARADLANYPSVEILEVHVEDAMREGSGFCIRLADGGTAWSRTMLLATGVKDDLPPIEGLLPLWGRGIFPCPYCDCWEERGKRLGVYGRGEEALATARALLGWSPDVVVFTDGPPGFAPEALQALARRKVDVVTERVVRFVAQPAGVQEPGDVTLTHVVVEGRPPVPCDALFMHSGQHQRSPLVGKLGCHVNARGTVDTGSFESTDVPGLFVAGDASRNVQLAIVAAAEGAEAAFAINRTLARQDFER
jgi:thioredoxin reductase